MSKNNISYPTVYLQSDQSAASLEIKGQATGIAGTVVKFETNLNNDRSKFYVELFNRKGSADTLTTKTTKNFLKYVNDGSYQNTIIHRSIDDFVIQSGGYKAPKKQLTVGGVPLAINSKGTVQNEPGNSNVRGTISMAKIGGDPDSATTQWFFNLSNNDFLDIDNGGFTAFGKVLGNGMKVVDSAAKIQTYNFGGAFSTLPLKNLTTKEENGEVSANLQPEDYLRFKTISEIKDKTKLYTYTAKSNNPQKVSVTITDEKMMQIAASGSKPGRVKITIKESSIIDNSKQYQHFFVNLPKSGRKLKSLIGSNSNDLLAGDNNSNILQGKKGDDQLFGYNNNDKLIGGKGKDNLHGGKGSDLFIYKSIKESLPGNKKRDVITDFDSNAGDRIDLGRIKKIKSPSGNRLKLEFIRDQSFSGAPGEIRFSDGILQVNMDNDSKPEMEIELINTISISIEQLIL